MRYSKLTWDRKTTYGFLIGLATILIAIPIVIFILSYSSADNVWRQFRVLHTKQAQVLSLSAIPNLAWFHFFLKKERYSLGYGIIYVTVLVLLMIITIKFIL